MITEHTRNEIWEEFLDASRLVRYYGKLESRNQIWYVGNRLLLLLFSLGGIVVLFDILPDSIRIVIGAFISLLIALEYVFNIGQKTAVLRYVYISCAELEDQWRILWNRIENNRIDETEIWREREELSRRCLQVTSKAKELGVRDNNRINKESAEEAYRVMEDRYVGPV